MDILSDWCSCNGWVRYADWGCGSGAKIELGQDHCNAVLPMLFYVMPIAFDFFSIDASMYGIYMGWIAALFL